MSEDDSPFAAERMLLARAKRLVIFALGRAAEEFGDKLNEEQEVLAHIADITMEVYALESAILRTEKLIAARGAEAGAVASDITRVYAGDAADRMEHSAKQVAVALSGAADASDLLEGVRRLMRHTPINTVAARRRIADAIIKAGRYYL